jgi:hypothetical protein
LNKKGQFSIIAALLVAVVLIGTVVVTYSTIRNSTVREQPPIQSAIDETNLAIKQILGFTVGYYGSILKSTGNSTYAKGLATDYLQSGLIYTTNMHPEWGTSFNVTSTQLQVSWYSNESYSSGSLSVSYNLTGLGITGITYDTSCSLAVQIMPTANNKAQLSVVKDEDEPLINLGKSNFKFYHYENATFGWNQVNPLNEQAYSNGTYQLSVPSGIDVNSYMIQVEDQRGVMVVASSFSYYTCNLAWNATKVENSVDNYVDNNASDVDFSSNKGTHSNFTAMQHGPDKIMDTLSESITDFGANESWIRPIEADGIGWTDPLKTCDNDTSTFASFQVPGSSWSNYLTLTGSAVSCHMIRYKANGDNKIDAVQIDVYNGTWTTVYNGTTNLNGNYKNVGNFSEMLVSAVRLKFHNGASTERSVSVYDVQYLKSGIPQNCELDLEVQWTDVNSNGTNPWLCINGGTMAQNENIRVNVWSNSTWKPLGPPLITGWNNFSVSQYIDSSNFTIQFKGAKESADPVKDSWQIDAAFLQNVEMSNTSATDNIVVELLQDGTMRWLGQNLELATQSEPFPPIPVKSIHLNQTIANISREMPFQTEDWASEYRIPLGLTSNASVFGSTTMLVFMASPAVSRVTIWWNGSDTAVQTPYAIYNPNTSPFKNDDTGSRKLTNEILTLTFSSDDLFTVTSALGSATSKASFLRINDEDPVFHASPAYVIHHGIVRDIVQQEAEYSGGVFGCPNFYSHIVLTLPANATYYTYQLRLMFVDSQKDRTISDLSILKLTIPIGQPQTENGTSGGSPVVSNSTGLFYNQSSTQWAHHWSQFISGNTGAGIMFTDLANQKLYFFDSMAGNVTGAFSVSNTGGNNVIELQPVTNATVSFKYALDIAWCGAVATFDTTPIYKSGGATGLWINVEYPPTVAVTTG